jgi:RimJ/RimL family protein N-acetyltransferase
MVLPNTIRTPRLLLRPLRQNDAEALHLAFADAEVMRYWSTTPHKTLRETENWVAQSLTGAGPDFAVERDGAVIGRVALWRGSELGFLFARASWGQGLGREAVGAVCSYGFGALGREVVTADVDPRNERSLRMLSGLGFRRTGAGARTWLVGDEWCDSIYLKLRPEELVGEAVRQAPE